MAVAELKMPAKRKGPTPRYTTAFVFTPSMMVSVAAKDILRRAKNIATSARRIDDPDDDTPIERYAFHPGDVRKATRPSDVLRKALKRAQGHKTVHTQKNRILLYGDIGVLRGALARAEHQEARQ